MPLKSMKLWTWRGWSIMIVVSVSVFVGKKIAETVQNYEIKSQKREVASLAFNGHKLYGKPKPVLALEVTKESLGSGIYLVTGHLREKEGLSSVEFNWFLKGVSVLEGEVSGEITDLNSPIQIKVYSENKGKVGLKTSTLIQGRSFGDYGEALLGEKEPSFLQKALSLDESSSKKVKPIYKGKKFFQ